MFSTKIGQKILMRPNKVGKKLLRKFDSTLVESHIPQNLGSVKLYREFIELLYSKKRWDRLNAVRSLFIFSTKDPFVKIPDKRIIKNYYPNSIVRVLQGGHWEFLHQSNYYADLINQHISQCGENNELIEI